MIYEEGAALCFDCFKKCMLAYGLSFRGTILASAALWRL